MFSYKDIQLAFEYAQNNSKSTLEDWFEYRRIKITKEDLESFNDVKYTTFNVSINGKDCKFYFFQDYSYNISSFITRFTGTKEYYEFNVTPGDAHYYSIITFDTEFGTLNNWIDYPGLKKVKFLLCDNPNIKFVCWDYPSDLDMDELDFENIGREERCLESNNKSFWNGDILSAYLSEELIDFKSIDDLFEII